MIAFIGEKDLWACLVPFSIDIFEIKNGVNALNTLDEVIASSKYDLIFISENIASNISNIDKYYKNKEINIVLFPSPRNLDVDEKETLSYKRIRAIVERAMGVDVLSK